MSKYYRACTICGHVHNPDGSCSRCHINTTKPGGPYPEGVELFDISMMLRWEAASKDRIDAVQELERTKLVVSRPEAEKAELCKALRDVVDSCDFCPGDGFLRDHPDIPCRVCGPILSVLAKYEKEST